MSNFSKKGRRVKSIDEKKEATKRMKEVYKIMDELDIVARDIYYSGEKPTEDNIVEVAAKYTSRTIESLEKYVLLSKLEILNGKEESRD